MSHRILAAALAVLPAMVAFAQPLTTTFTLQGRLDNGGSPASGLYDFRFTLFDAASAGTQLGPILCVNNVSVANGVFTAQLDFGGQFTGQQQFLEVWARPDTGLDCSTNANFTTLSPRQNLTASPNAVYSLNAATAGSALTATNATQLNGQGPSFYTNAGNLASGTIPDARLSSSVDLVNSLQTITATKNFSVAPRFTTASGPPFIIVSTTGLVANLNADLLDGLHSTGFLQLAGAQTVTGAKTFSAPPAFTVASGPPFTIASATGLVANLNADLLDGTDSSGFVQTTGTQTVLGVKTFGTNTVFNGNVGIGLPDPSNRLHIRDGVLLVDSSTGGSVRILVTNNHFGSVAPTNPAGMAVVQMGESTYTGFGGELIIFNNNGMGLAGLQMTATNQCTLTAQIKNFMVPNPDDPKTDIYYACVEGPEAAMYCRGTARLADGHAVVDLPRHFAAMAAEKGITVQVTPLSAECLGIAVTHKSTSSFEVTELLRGRSDSEFDWEVKAVRQGYEDYKVVRPAGLLTAKGAEPAATPPDHARGQGL